MNQSTVDWLLEGDPAIVYQTRRHLLQASQSELRKAQRAIARVGWGHRLLQKQGPDGHWGRGAYQPKWICTHYTLLDLKTLGIQAENAACRKAVELLLANKVGRDGGINYARTVPYSDVCINGMLLNIASYFLPRAERLHPIVDYLLARQFPDGGWNCLYYQGATHGSFHTTIGVLEGLAECCQAGEGYRRRDTQQAISDGLEFLLVHKLCRSHTTGKLVDPRMLCLSFPSRWRYDILRGLELFCSLRASYDERMSDALAVLKQKRRGDGRWPLQLKHPGQTHLEMEKVGRDSRWNTLRATRVLRHFGQDTEAHSVPQGHA